MNIPPVEPAFWQNRLEVAVEQVSQRYADERERKQWANKLSPRQRAVIAECVPMFVPLEKQVLLHNFAGWKDALAPFFFCDEFAKGKLSHAILEIARHRLTEKELRNGRPKDNDEGAFDKEALVWRLYKQNPANLELVFHLEKIHRKGFARMRSRETLPANDQASEALTPSFVESVLTEYEKQTKSNRSSLCAAVLENGGNRLVFIKRDLQPAFVSRGRENIYGFEREWIILEVEPDLQRVHISSESPDVPLEIANALASKLLGRAVFYENEAVDTQEEKILAFFRALLSDPDAVADGGGGCEKHSVAGGSEDEDREHFE